MVGFGRIGAAVAKRIAAFDMHILGYDPIKPAEQIRQEGGEPVGFDELLARSDFITLHLPLTAQARNMLNGEVFEE